MDQPTSYHSCTYRMYFQIAPIHYVTEGLKVHIITELSLKKLIWVVQIRYQVLGHFYHTFDVHYLEITRNQGNGCCKELVSSLYNACKC